MSRIAENVVGFYNKRDTCEQWVEEGKGASKATPRKTPGLVKNAE
jgi:hypothetical protein